MRAYSLFYISDHTSNVIYLCCCGSTRSLTMQTGRSALEAPVPSRRTACRHVPPSLRSTPCQSGTDPTAPPCRMEQVTTWNNSPVLWLASERSFKPLTTQLKCWPAINSLRVCCLSHWCESIKGLKVIVQPASELQWSGNSSSEKILHQCSVWAGQSGRLATDGAGISSR